MDLVAEPRHHAIAPIDEERSCLHPDECAGEAFGEVVGAAPILKQVFHPPAHPLIFGQRLQLADFFQGKARCRSARARAAGRSTNRRRARQEQRRAPSNSRQMPDRRLRQWIRNHAVKWRRRLPSTGLGGWQDAIAPSSRRSRPPGKVREKRYCAERSKNAMDSEAHLREERRAASSAVTTAQNKVRVPPSRLPEYVRAKRVRIGYKFGYGGHRQAKPGIAPEARDRRTCATTRTGKAEAVDFVEQRKKSFATSSIPCAKRVDEGKVAGGEQVSDLKQSLDDCVCSWLWGGWKGDALDEQRTKISAAVDSTKKRLEPVEKSIRERIEDSGESAENQAQRVGSRPGNSRCRRRTGAWPARRTSSKAI